MFATLLKVTLFAAISIQAVQADFSVSQPEFTQCQEATFSWQKTKGPYNILITKDDNPCGDALADLGDFDGTTGTWKVALPAGIKVQLSVEDANGDEAWTQTITVKGSDDASCVPPALRANGAPSPKAPASSSASPSAKSSSLAPVPTATASTSTESPSVAPPVAVDGTTLVVPATTVSSTSGPAPTPVGAVNSGSDPFSKAAANSASALHNTNLPIMVVAAVSAFFAFSL